MDKRRVLVISAGAAISANTRMLLDCLATRGDDVVIFESDNVIRGVNQRPDPVILEDICVSRRHAFYDTYPQSNGREEKRSRKFARRTRTEGWDNARYAK